MNHSMYRNETLNYEETTMKKVIDSIAYVYPLVLVYPRWAQYLFLATVAFVAATCVVFLVLLPSAKDRLDPSRRPALSRLSYDGFENDFRHVIAPHVIPESGSFLHIVWGDLGAIRNTTVVIPVSQSFDFAQRGGQSVLSAFASHTVGGVAFYDYMDESWPPSDRPKSAAVGTTQHIPLENESHGLSGVVFVVTTSDESRDPKDYGHYKNTPVSTIEYAIDKVLKEAVAQKVPSIAIPMIGAGYANIKQTYLNSKLKELLEHTIALMAIDALLTELSSKTAPLRRGVVVIYSTDPHGEQDNPLWESSPRFIQSAEEERKEQIKMLLNQIASEAAKGA